MIQGIPLRFMPNETTFHTESYGQKFFIHLHTTSAHLSPEELAQLVALPFRYCIGAGEIRPGTKKAVTQSECFYDLIESNGHFPTVLAAMVQRLEESLSQDEAFRAQCCFFLECILEAKEFMPPMYFTHQTMEKLARLKIDIDFDLYEQYFFD